MDLPPVMIRVKCALFPRFVDVLQNNRNADSNSSLSDFTFCRFPVLRKKGLRPNTKARNIAKQIFDESLIRKYASFN